MRPPMPVVLLAVAASAYLWAIFITIFAHPGALGWDFNTPGNDYMVFHAAVNEALRGHTRLIYDVDGFTALMNERYSSFLSYPLIVRPWVNPPGMLVLLLPFAALPFLASYALFQITSAGALWLAIRTRGAAGSTLIAAASLLCPAGAVSVICGQASFLTAALLIGGTRLLRGTPLWGGAVLGLLSAKPQHAVLVPFVLLAMRSARGAAGACLSAASLALIGWGLFGTEAWTGWVGVTARNLAGGEPAWFWHNQIWDSSVQTCAYLLGAGRRVAMSIAVIVALASAATVYAAFRSSRTFNLKIAVLLAATTLAAPHTGPYDLVLLVSAAGLFLADRQTAKLAWPWGLACCLWILPVLHQPVVSPPARLGPVLAAALVVALMLIRREEVLGGMSHPPQTPRH